MKNITKEIKKYLKERGWENLHPEDISKSIVIESAELLEIFQWNTGKNKKKIETEDLKKIKKELADILIYCLDMAIILKIDPERIILDKLKKVKEKYPKEIFNKKNKDKYLTKKYLEIKQDFRKKGIN